MTSNENEFDDPLEHILTEYSRRLRDGESPSIDEYARRYPELSDILQELLPTVALLEQKRETIPATTSGRWKIPRLEKLGEFEMIREIGRGGMGVVYEARQLSLDRRVAVKVLPEPVSQTPNGLLRFQREAKAAARLHHAGIVSVLGTGQFDETAYIVMQFVDGVGLDRVNQALARIAMTNEEDSPDPVATTIAKRMLSVDLDDAGQSCNDLDNGDQHSRPGKNFFRNVARLGMQFASALQHAHDHQVLHRDIKPSNLLVDRQGAGWIADFGLARILEDNDASLTNGQGGTPRYMAPEQQGGAARSGTDIYCLGLSIYELLMSAGRGSGKPVSLDRPLASLPNGLPGTPADLEKIVLKATETDVDKRYHQASSMAEDFRRFLEYEPVQVERTAWGTRINRWARRNPQLAGLSMLVSILVAAIATVSTISYFNELKQRRRTESALHVAMTTLDTVYQSLAPMTEVVGSTGSDATFREQPQLSQSSASLLNDLLSTWDELAAIVGNDRQLKLDAAIAEFRVGEIHRRLGDWSTAQLHLEQAARRLLLIRDSDLPDLDEITVSIAQVYISMGIVNSGSRLNSDREYLLDAIRFAEEVETRHIAGAGDSRKVESKTAVLDNARFEKARAHFYLGRRPKTAYVKEADSADPPSPWSSVDLDQAINLLEQWGATRPSRVSDLLALCYNQRAEEFNDGFTNFAIGIQQKLVEEYPAVQEFRTNLADMYSKVDPRHIKPSDYPEAIRRLLKSIEIVKLLDRNEVRNCIIWQHDHHKLSLLFRKMALNDAKRFDEVLLDQSVLITTGQQSLFDLAILHARAALQIQESWVDRNSDSVTPGNDLEQVWQIRFAESLARALKARNQPGDNDEAKQVIANITHKFDGDLAGTRYEAMIKQSLSALNANEENDPN